MSGGREAGGSGTGWSGLASVGVRDGVGSGAREGGEGVSGGAFGALDVSVRRRSGPASIGILVWARLWGGGETEAVVDVVTEGMD